MFRKTKKRGLLISLLCIMFACFSAVFAISCSNNAKPGSLSVSNVSITTIGQTYNPEIVASGSCKILEVQLLDKNFTEVEVNEEDYSFVPQLMGNYFYKILYEINGTQYEKQLVVYSRDVSAPTVVQPFEGTKQIEAGIYKDFEQDIKKFVFTDDNASGLHHLSMEIVEVRFGQQVLAQSEEGFDSFVFDKLGEHTVVVSVKDLAGNQLKTEYKVNVVDTHAPEIDIPSVTYAWAVEDKATLPVPAVRDLFDCQIVNVEVEGKTVVDNAVDAQVGDQLNVTYTAEDANGNQSTLTVLLKVIADGMLFDKEDDVFGELFTSSAIIFKNNGASFIDYSSNNCTVVFKQNQPLFTNLSNVKGVEIVIANNNNDSGVVEVYAVNEQDEICVGEVELYPVDNANNRAATYLDVADLTTVESWKFVAKTQGSVHFTIESIKLLATENPALNGVDNTYDVAVVDESCEIEVDKQVSAQANAIKLPVYASKNGKVTIGFKFDGDAKEYKSTANLVAGANVLSLIIDTDNVNANFAEKTLKTIYIYNEKNYVNTLYVDVDQIQFVNATELNVISASLPSQIKVDFNSKFVVPSFIDCDMDLIKSYSAKLLENGKVEQEAISLSIGQGVVIRSQDGSAINYTLTINVVDAFNQTHTRTVDVVALAQVLQLSIPRATYKEGNPISLPTAIVSSVAYPNLQGDDVAVTNYYKFGKGEQWSKVDGELEFAYSDSIMIAYLAEYDGNFVVQFNETYLHREGITFDYEPYAGKDILNCDGANLGEGTWFYGMKDSNPNHYITISDKWANTGRYSLELHHTGNSVLSLLWSTQEGMGAGKTVNGVWQSEAAYRKDFRFGYEANTVSFWLNASGDGRIGFSISNMKQSTGVNTTTGEIYIDVKAGVQQCVVPLGVTIDGCYVINFFGTGYVYYSIDDVSFFHSGTPDYTDLDGAVLYSDAEFTIEKPVLENPSPITFSDEDMQNAVYTVNLVDETGFVLRSYDFDKDGTSIDFQLPKGLYKFEYTIQLADLVYKHTQNFEVKWFEVEYTAPNGVYAVNVEHQFEMPTTLKPDPIYKAFYRFGSQGDWTQMDVLDNKAKATFDKVGTYEIKFETTSLGNTESNIYKVVVLGDNSFASFEKDGAAVHGFDSLVNAQISNDWVNDGYSSLYVNVTDRTQPTKIEYQTAQVVQESNSIKMVINSETAQKSAMQLLLTVDGEGKVIKSDSVEIVEGVNTYLFRFEEDFTNIYAIEINSNSTNLNKFYIDTVTVEKYTLTFPTDLKDAVFNDVPYEFGEFEINFDGRIIVKWKYVDSQEEYQEVALEDGKYSITLYSEGYVEIVVQAVGEDFKLVETYTFRVASRTEDPSSPDFDFDE